MHLSMFSPRGGGGGEAGSCVAFDKTCPPESGEFDWKVRPHGRAIWMCRVKDWAQVCFAARVRVSGECLFTVFSLKSVGLVGCLFISELDFLEKGAVLFSKKSCSTLCRFGNDWECRGSIKACTCTTGDHKDVEYIRVNGSADEGPAHEEVQNWWTRHHLETKSLATLVSTRNSGRSFKNRVELQNSCLALGHANTFIPSTLNGSCVQNGKVSEEILKKGIDLEIDVCISRVDKCPCAGTVINLYKGACSTDLQHERVAIKTFLKGKERRKT